MRVVVFGQKGDGPILKRVVKPSEFFEAFGPYARFLWDNARTQTVDVEGHRIRVYLR